MSDLEMMRHSLAHVMAYAVKNLYQNVQFGIGPSTEDGFYYDFDFAEKITENDLSAIQKELLSILKKNIPFIRKEVSKQEALSLFNGQKYKVELIQELSNEDVITVYELGDFVDLCRGPHVESTKDLPRNAHRLLSLAGAYWRGNEKNKMLQRIYATSWGTKDELKSYLTRLEEAKKRDHRKLGKELDLFSINETVGPGLVHWHPKGARIRSIVEDFWKRTHFKSGYELINTPHIGNAKLWETSGHLSNFTEFMYSPMIIDDIKYYTKPMNCPFHIQIYNAKSRSYRELPLRWAELGTVYRYEKSGVLHGLLRVRGFTQDDAHIICTRDQIIEEISRTVKFARKMWKAFGFSEISAYIATRPEKAVGNDSDWELAIHSLEIALKDEDINFEMDEGGGAFYGPKIDMKVKDAIGREWQVTTIQFDFNLPDRFNMTYVGEDGQKHRPLMVHRALLGSIERFFGILIEHYAGKFPMWLSPEQVRILPISDSTMDYCKKVESLFLQHDLRCNIDSQQAPLGARIRRARMDRIPYIAVVGDEEIKNESISLRDRDTGKDIQIELNECLEHLIGKSQMPFDTILSEG